MTDINLPVEVGFAGKTITLSTDALTELETAGWTVPSSRGYAPSQWRRQDTSPVAPGPNVWMNGVHSGWPVSVRRLRPRLSGLRLSRTSCRLKQSLCVREADSTHGVCIEVKKPRKQKNG